MAGRAKRLEGSTPELDRVTTMPLDMVAIGRSSDAPGFLTHSAYRLAGQLELGNCLPSSSEIPPAPWALAALPIVLPLPLFGRCHVGRPERLRFARHTLDTRKATVRPPCHSSSHSSSTCPESMSRKRGDRRAGADRCTDLGITPRTLVRFRGSLLDHQLVH